MVQPPADVAPERLFRLLLPLRPTMALAYRIRCAPTVPLRVRALSVAEEAEALDLAAEAPPEIRGSRTELEVLARCLYTPSGRAFDGPENLARLDELDVAALAREAAVALSRIAPTYGRVDLGAWRQALEKGASHPSNFSTAFAMEACWDPVPMSNARVARPDRYWGVPARKLLDGHLMAFRAASAALESMRKSG